MTTTPKRISNRRKLIDMAKAQSEVFKDIKLIMFWAEHNLNEEQLSSFNATLANTSIISKALK